VTVDSCSFTGHATGIAIASTGSCTGVTVRNCVIILTGGTPGNFGIKLGSGNPTDVTISRCTVAGADARANRVEYGITDAGGHGVGTIIEYCDISNCRVAINTGRGIVRECYMHDFGWAFGDHIDGVFVPTTQGPVLIQHNTILMQTTQTSPVPCLGNAILDVTIDSNLIAGGGYGIYAAGQPMTRTGCALTASSTAVTSASVMSGDVNAYVTDTTNPGNIAPGTFVAASPAPVQGASFTLSQPALGTSTDTLVMHGGNGTVVTNNRFSTMFFPLVGEFGPVDAWDPAGLGNTWTGNVIHDTGAVIPEPS
jgi:hypothetical protein